jgi:hypothetical protein
VSDLASSANDNARERDKGDLSDDEPLKKPAHKFYSKSSDSNAGKRDREEKKEDGREAHVIFDLGPLKVLWFGWSFLLSVSRLVDYLHNIHVRR